MSPPESERSSSLPTLTWESIVDRKPTADGASETSPQVDSDQSQPVAALDNAVPPPPPVASSFAADEDAPVWPLSLHLGDVNSPPPPPPPPLPTSAPATRGSVSSEAVADFHVSFAPIALEDGRVVPEPGSSLDTDVAAVTGMNIDSEPEMLLPPIREATPVQPYLSDEVPVPASPSALPTTTVATIDAGATPLIPGSQPGPITLPPATQPDQSGARLAAPVSPLAVEIPQRAPAKKRRGRSGLKLVFLLVVLGAIVAAGIVFGRPYLFPDDSAENAKPYATAVESVTGSEFAEPLTVTAEPTTTYQPRSTTQLVGDFAEQVPTWRALGLATGDVTEAGMVELVEGWEPAMYSTVDGQIYHDDTLATPALEAELTSAMATAWLDQQFGWALGQTDRSLDAAAMTSAEVQAQSEAILAASEYDNELVTPSTGPLLYLPAVISYQILAPSMYAPLLAPVAEGAENPLSSLDAPQATWAGGLASEVLELASAATLTEGDVVVGSPAAMDRSFWYLVFAGFLDAPTAYAASESIVESALTITERAGTTCAYATFSGGDLIQTQTLRSAMESWVGLTPPEMASAFTVGADGNLQMQSCDPGTQTIVSTRLGVARELVGWRSAELATVSGVLAAGGGAPEITAALDRLAVSTVGAQLATGPVDQSPADSAAAARAAVEPIVTPPPPPVVEPAE